MLKGLAVLFLGLSLAQAGLKSEWVKYKDTHGKKYGLEEDDFRRNIWQKSMVEITAHNVLFYKGESSYMMKENKFADMTPEEQKSYTGPNFHVPKYDYRRRQEIIFDFGIDVPKEIDWREKGYVTPVKNQGKCRSSWAFAATGSIEGQHFRVKKELISMSESNLIDCCVKEGCKGCTSGTPSQAMEYVYHQGGVDTEKSYPYHPVQGKCNFTKGNIGASISGYFTPPPTEEYLKNTTGQWGPVSVMINSTGNFKYYMEGVYDNPDCAGDVLDLSLLVVGYGTTSDGTDYWLLKNSWGEDWGEQGYVRMVRNRKNQCGIANQAAIPMM